MKKGFVFTILFPIISILSQSLYFDSGFYKLTKLRQFCTCNHNSKKEVHLKTNLSDCHEKKDTRHICKCKKSKNSNQDVHLIKQIQSILNQNSILLIHKTEIKYITIQVKIILQGFKLILIKPPKIS